MGYGGLRGAVGLALAIAVTHTPGFSQADGERYLFHIGGVAALTLLINGVLGAWVLTKLGLLDTTRAQQRAILEARQEVILQMGNQYKTLSAHSMYSLHNKQAMRTVMDNIEKQVNPMTFSLQATITKADAVDDRFLAVMRTAFLNCLTQEYWNLIHIGMLPMEDANRLLHSTKAAIDDASTTLTTYDKLKESFEQTSVLDRVAERIFGEHKKVNTKHMLTCTLAFIEAHRRAEKKVFGIFGDGEGVDCAEEEELEKEVAAQVEGAENHVQEVTMSTKEKTDTVTDLIAVALKTACVGVVGSMQKKGLIAPADAKEIVADIEKAVESLGAAQNPLNRMLSRSGLRKSDSGESSSKKSGNTDIADIEADIKIGAS